MTQGSLFPEKPRDMSNFKDIIKPPPVIEPEELILETEERLISRRCVNCDRLGFRMRDTGEPTHRCQVLGLTLVDEDLLLQHTCPSWKDIEKPGRNAALDFAAGDNQRQMKEARLRMQAAGLIPDKMFS